MTQPLWLDPKINNAQQTDSDFAPLQEDLEVDVAIVGGGITGIVTAYLLKQAGMTVAVLERGEIAGGETGHTTAHLTMVTDSRLHELVKVHGRDGARLAWKGGQQAIEMLEQIVRREGLDCQWQRVPGYLHAAIESDANLRELREEAALAEELGFETNFVEHIPVMGRPGVRYSGQARFHPAQFVRQLARRVRGNGSHVFGATGVEKVETDPLIVRASRYQVRCDRLVMATHAPLPGTESMLTGIWLQSRLAPYSTYAVAATVAGAPHPALYWDTAQPYFYVRIDAGSPTRVIVGGADHKTGQEDQTEQRFNEVENHLHRIFTGVEITHRWSGQVLETDDGLPFIGAITDCQFVATGFAGNGMTLGPLSGAIIRDALCHEPNPYMELFSPHRRPGVRGAWEYLRENASYPYYMLRDRLRSAPSESFASVAPGEGRVIEQAGQRLAVYRDEDGDVHAVSAICTHMGCVVHWNKAERTWDCPCHGSRFHTDGEVMCGPAIRPLERHSEPAPTKSTG
jgi:glycine/D-amino acid oxidase-like deaminating enzyme/nitrite reductase/ring-hydroxylating ferredoxin subunit